MQQKSQRTSLGRRLQHALTGGPNRRFPGLHPSPGGAASIPPYLNRRLALPILAILALLAASLLFLLPGGPLQAQDDAIEYPEKGMGPVETYTASDPEGASVSWSLGGVDAEDFTIDNGVLRFAETPNYESPKGGASAPFTNTYVVNVQATDETRRTKSETVTVEVTNVEEAGKVTLSARRPQTDTVFTAEVTDPDDGVADIKWQWAKAGSKNGTYRDIDDATSGTYTPEDADSGSYLRATATYEDTEGEGKTAMMVSEFPSQRITGGNDAPEFDAVQDPDGENDAAKAIAKRSVAENTDAGKTVGSPVVATDDNGDTLTYTLTNADGGTDGAAASFGIDWGTGQILTKGDLDHETTGTYTVFVRATDPSGRPSVETAESANSDAVEVTITVTDVNEAPTIDGDAAVSFEEDMGDITAVLATYTGADEDVEGDPHPGTVTSWSVSGADGDKFNIGNETDGTPGQLKFKKKPDYEKPTDADMDNVYEVTVQASDGKKTGMMKVEVTVTNENEDGVVTLDKVTPVVGIPVTASLTDPDGGVSKLTWQWSITGASSVSVPDVTSTDDGDITGATSDTYKPKAGDVGGTLTATASYFDGESAVDATAKKDANQAADNEVELDTRNKAPVFGDEDPDADGVQNAMAARKVEENTEALAGATGEADADDDALTTDNSADNVGAAVTATDTKADGSPETLSYSLSGADAAKFRVRDNGQIEVAAGTELDYEGKRTYMVTVTARDPLGESSSIDVTITVTGVDEAPEISGDDAIEYPEKGMGSVETYTASDPEGASVSWSLGGVDAGAFTIENGVLRFAKTPNYETAADDNTDNTYVVDVQATDETRRTKSETVTVEVTNVEEAGKVTLSARRPQTDTVFTAEVTDPDDGVADIKWQWAKAGSKNGTYRDIDDATSGTYTPEDADSGSYLRATATYEDTEGEGKTAMMVSEFPSQRITGGNDAPEFDAVQDPDGENDAAKAIAKRSVAENTDAGKTVGSPVVATDDNSDTLTYTLTNADGGTDGAAASFGIDWGTGQILTKGDLDHETTGTYTVFVRATDPSGRPSVETAESANSDAVEVTITVTDVNEAPTIDGDAAVSFEEDMGDITAVLATYTGADEDVEGDPHPGTVTSWSVSGADGDKFNIGNETDGTPGQLKFKKKPDYEKPTDADMDNVYEVTVQASDGKKTGMMKVEVTVTNENEDGVVTLDKVTPVVGIPVTASLTDPDGGVSKLTWQWSITGASSVSVPDVTSTDDGDITGATSDTYKPKAGDVGGTLTATASYFDGESAVDATAKKDANQAADNEVELDTRNKAPVFGDEDPDTDGVQNAMAARKVEENTEALAGATGEADADDDALATDNSADNVGAAVTATDTKADGSPETLSYSLSGADAAKFRVRDNGQIEVAAGTELDYEGKRTYMVTVMARDPLGESSSIDVTITVTGVDEAPVISMGGLAVTGQSAIDYAEKRTDMVATYSAAGPDAARATWSLEGDDAGDFRISTAGVLTFRTTPDYEAPVDAGTDNVYQVTVEANDGTNTATKAVTVVVTNVNEDGMVTLSSQTPVVGIALTTILSDADGGVTGVKWQWASENTDGTFADIAGAGATSGNYTPADADVGKRLRVTASYTDGHGSGKSAMAESDNAVSAIPTTVVDSYDADGSGTIERAEVGQAVRDFIGRQIEEDDVLKVIAQYFKDLRSGS